MLRKIPNIRHIGSLFSICEVYIEHIHRNGTPTEDAYPSGHLVLSHLGLACVLMLRPISNEFVLFPKV